MFVLLRFFGWISKGVGERVRLVDWTPFQAQPPVAAEGRKQEVDTLTHNNKGED